LATISSSFLTSGSSVKDNIAIGTKTNPASQEAVFRRNFEKSILKSSTGNDSSGIGHIGEFLGLVAGLFRESKTGLVKVLAPKKTREPSENAVQTQVKKGEPKVGVLRDSHYLFSTPYSRPTGTDSRAGYGDLTFHKLALRNLL
jgi:hypothetical protein